MSHAEDNLMNKPSDVRPRCALGGGSLSVPASEILRVADALEGNAITRDSIRGDGLALTELQQRCARESEALRYCAKALRQIAIIGDSGLAGLWEDEARALRSNASRALGPKAEMRARQLENCAQEIRRLLAPSNERQPEENGGDERRARTTTEQ